jgi:hypothetical protein
MKWLCWLWIALFVPAVFCGCGGSSPSQAEMRKYALRRSSDDDEDDEDQQSAPVAQPANQPDAAQTPVAGTASQSTNPPAVGDLPRGPAGSGSQGAPATPDGGVTDENAAAPPAASDSDGQTGAESGQPQTVSERRQRSIDNLQAIAAAILAALEDRGEFPRPALYDLANQPLLSWRVALLPYLGHQDLYNRFNKEQPWDSPQNLALLAEIPDVYRSPERWDDKTNYLVPRDGNTLFPDTRRLFKSHVEDGLSHTALLLEVDDGRAVPWTQPMDYPVDYETPAQGLGELRSGHFFLAWADGTVRSVSAGIAAEHWKAMFTRDSGERFSASLVSSPATADVPELPVAQPAEPAVVASQNDGDNGTSNRGAEPGAPAVASSGAGQPPAPAAGAATPVSATITPRPGAVRAVPGAAATAAERLPVPPDDQRRRASQLFSSLYRSEYLQAKLDEDKQDLAEKMLQQADKLKTDPVGRFVALDVGRKIAAEAGDIRLAMDAAEDLIGEFAVNDLEIKADVLSATLRRSLSDADNSLVLEEAAATAREALARNELELADQLITAALGAARRTRDQQQITDIVALKKRIDRARDAYSRILEAVEQLGDTADDPAANLTAGSYFCFVVQRWDDGLPMLARGSDLRLAEAAQLELQPPQTADQQVAVADLWWELAQSGGRHSDAMQARAVEWYQRALPELAAGMQRVKAEVRIRQAGQ